MTKDLRVLFCISVKQNFMDATGDEQMAVWKAFSTMMDKNAQYGGHRYARYARR